MSLDQFEYVGPPDFHDGHVLEVSEPGPQVVEVRVRGSEGKVYKVVFRGVRRLVAADAEGMMLYALSRRVEAEGGFRFEFANWDENGSGRLEIVATGMAIGPEEGAA